MTRPKHPATPADRKQGLGADLPKPPDDLSRNPGINSAKGVFSRTGANPEELEGGNTAEGDVMNDTDDQGAVPEQRRGRTNP